LFDHNDDKEEQHNQLIDIDIQTLRRLVRTKKNSYIFKGLSSSGQHFQF